MRDSGYLRSRPIARALRWLTAALMAPLQASLHAALLAVLLLLSACDTQLPIEVAEDRFNEAGLSLSVSSINFAPTFIGRTIRQTISIEYGDTLNMELSLFTSDSAAFTVQPDSIHFSKTLRTAQIQIAYTPRVPDAPDYGYLYLVAYGNFDSLDAEPDTAGVDSLRLAGVGRGGYLDLELVFIPGGSFTMGIDSATAAAAGSERHDEWPAHEVTLGDFFIGRYEVTNMQYYEFWREDSTVHTPRDTSVIGHWPAVALDQPNHPVIGVSWEDAGAFCRWLSLRTGERYRLPTEAQWEYAATGGQAREYPWSAPAGDTTAGNGGSQAAPANTRQGGDGFTFTAPVGSFPEGASAFGPLNMSGNVWEWCQDWYDPAWYRREVVRVDPQGPTDIEHQFYKVVRGGSWLELLNQARTGNRGALAPGNQEVNVGFRVARLP